MSYILESAFIDFLSIIESKLDDSFMDAQFEVKGFNMYRQDSTATSGGIITWLRNDVPNHRRYDIEVNNLHIQSLVVEMHIKKEKWFIISVYRLPGAIVNEFTESLSRMLDRILIESKMVTVIGDINVNMLNVDNKSNAINDLLCLYNMENIVCEPTCFKSENASLIDVAVTTYPRRYCKVLNYNCGLSDYHNLIAISTKIHVPKCKPRTIFYRSYKKFKEDEFKLDVSRIPFHVANVFNEIDDVYWAHSKMMMDVVNNHAPLKKKLIRRTSAPHMNCNLKKVMYQKRMAQNRFWKYRGNSRNWEEYRKKRNEFVKINRASRQNYFRENCKEGNSKTFWKTVRPYISNKGVQSNDFMLKEGDDIITDAKTIASVFNEYFISITNEIGMNENNGNLSADEMLDKYKDHESIKSILQNQKENEFNFHLVSPDQMYKLLCQINVKKSTGYDNLPPKLLSVASKELAFPMSQLINSCIVNTYFPTDLKYAEISPIFKKDNKLDKSKYRPVSILSCVSKVFEKVIETQISNHFYCKIAGNVSAYRKNYSTQSVLIRAIEDWKMSLDSGKYVGALLMDLSKAFDVVPHGLLIAKMNAYGYGENVIKFILSYITNRRQRVKIYDARSDWNVLQKGVPQGSNLGPLLFNIFLNDIFYTMKDYSLYNYADDNTVAYCADSANDLKFNLELCGNLMTEWFNMNGMQANPDKYQVITFGNKSDVFSEITVKGIKLVCKSEVLLLGIQIDSALNFNKQIQHVYSKASRQINAIMRLCNVLDTEVKEAIYKSFIHCNFSYCPVIWLLCSNYNIKRLEKLQFRALKFVNNDFESSCEELLSKSNVLSISIHLLHNIAIEVYKCINNLAPDYLCNIFERQDNHYGTRNVNKLIQNRFKTYKYGYQSFKYIGSKVWNNIPSEIKNVESLREFKYNIKKWKSNCMYRVDNELVYS